MSVFLAAVETARHVISSIVILAGLLGLAASIAAQIRYPDFFTRLQGASLAPFMALVVLAGLAVEAWDGRLAARLAMLGVFVALIAPVRLYLLAGGAHAAGLAPRVGRQKLHAEGGS